MGCLLWGMPWGIVTALQAELQPEPSIWTRVVSGIVVAAMPGIIVKLAYPLKFTDTADGWAIPCTKASTLASARCSASGSRSSAWSPSKHASNDDAPCAPPMNAAPCPTSSTCTRYPRTPSGARTASPRPENACE